ncbi:polysaccharide biosynthesis tyrosine autokinase [bacterium]|nr:polysaccharide biosynthesis tyrosine autokinase [bacterium]
MDLRKILEIILRRRWIIIQAFLIILLSAILCSFFLPSRYSSSAKVIMETSTTASSILSSLDLTNLAQSRLTKSGTEIENRIELATSSPILDKVISRLQLKSGNGDLLRHSELKTSGIISSRIFTKPYLEVTQVNDTDIFKIEASAADPKTAAMIANTLVDVYIEENLRQRRIEFANAKSFIEGQIEVSKAAYLDALEEIKRFKIKEGTVDLNTEINEAIRKVTDLLNEKEKGIIEINKTRAKLDTLKDQLGRQTGITVSSSAISENPQIDHLKKMITDLELNLAEILTENTPDHPDARIIQEKIKKAKEELAYEVGVFQKSSQDLETFEREISGMEAHLKCVQTDIDKYLSDLYTFPDKTLTQSQLELKLSASQKLYSSLLEYLYKVGVAEAMTLSDIRLVEPAAEPNINKPESPNMVLNGIVGAFLGVIFGFGMAFLIDYLDDTIKSQEEAKQHNVTFLGVIPRSKRRESPIILKRDPKDPFCEAYRTVLNSIRFASLDKPVKTLVISSSFQGEGKTTTVIDLGIFICREGKKVLIVDTDLRKPDMHRIFKKPNTTGIVNVLAGDADIDEAVKKTEVEGLNLLCSGPIPPDPGLLTESDKMKELVKGLKDRFDFVILDTPPILAANDARILAGYTDALVLVLESRKVTHRAFSQALEFLKQANIRPLGMLLNKLAIGKITYYYNYHYK